MSLPTKEGFVMLYRARRGWKQRYIKLNRTYLQVFEAQHAPSPKQSVLRVDVTGVSVSDSFPDRKHCLELVFKSGSDKWYITAASEHDMKEWRRILLAHLPPQPVDEFDKRQLMQAEGATSEPSIPVPTLPSYMRDTQEAPPPYNTEYRP